jgi:hypothetical protein
MHHNRSFLHEYLTLKKCIISGDKAKIIDWQAFKRLSSKKAE